MLEAKSSRGKVSQDALMGCLDILLFCYDPRISSSISLYVVPDKIAVYRGTENSVHLHRQ